MNTCGYCSAALCLSVLSVVSVLCVCCVFLIIISLDHLSAALSLKSLCFYFLFYGIVVF